MDLVAGDVDPVRHLARVLVAPEVAGDAGEGDRGRSGEGRSRRGLVGHSSRPGSWIRWAGVPRSSARSKRGGSKVLSMVTDRPVRPDSIVASMISRTWK